ncbi:MAG: 2Fe-2S iron-sulfur cluster binding domain-containing protein [Chloroflexi bacterium]|nr:2Fe-2S iron-sulfur cluster binding domain-containing protein [Chloroflexota bacterium]
MNIQFNLNGQPKQFSCEASETLMSLLRRNGVWSVKHGCETGECGSCSVLFDGKLVPTCILLAAQADGHNIVTVEYLTQGQEVHPIQQAFIDTGSIQCGYCTPAMILATKALLEKEKNPSEAQAREALSGALCRCTGYVKPVQAVMRAAALMRGEDVEPLNNGGGIPVELFNRRANPDDESPHTSGGVATQARVVLTPTITAQPQTEVVGRSEPKVDSVKLAKGRPVFTDDVDLPNMLYAALLTSRTRTRESKI